MAMAQTPKIEPLVGKSFGLIADAHIRLGKGPALPARVADIFSGVDAIIALGDLGEAAGLDALEKIAPIIGVIGANDALGDARISAEVRLFAIGDLTVGAVFDGVKQSPFFSSDPLVPLVDFPQAVARRFGRKVDVLLCASTHTLVVASIAGILIINPGSPTLADAKTLAVLQIDGPVARVAQFSV
jgi:putative phosphoesterase